MDLKITPSGQTIVKPTALGPVANTDTKLLIYGLFQKGRVLAQDGIRKALKPLLGEEHLSKSAVSRVVSRLKERFEEWQNRALSEEVYAIVYLDGFHLKVRMAKRVISVPVLVALGVAPDGHKRLLSLRLAVSEASTHWGSVLEGLQARGLRAPKLVISLRIPSCHVEIDSNDQCSGESQPRVSTPDENPSVVLQRGVRGRFAVWAYRLWPDSTTTPRRLPTSERGSRTRGGCRLI